MDKFLNFLGICKKSGNLIEGYNKVTNSIKNTSLVIISKDASQNTIEEIKSICVKENINFIVDYDKIKLGNSIGRNEIKVVSIKDKGFSKKLLELYSENINRG